MHADKLAILELADNMAKVTSQKGQEYQEGFNINLAVDQRMEREAHRVSAIVRQAEMWTALTELTIQEWHDQREAVTKAQKAGDEMHWVYDHLPVAMWRGNMSEENHTKYDEVFEKVEPYIRSICGFVWQIYLYTMRSMELCTALIYRNIAPTLEATYFLTRWLLPFGILDWKTLRQTMSVCHPPLLNDEFQGALGNAVNIQTIPIPPVLTFNWFFPIGHELEGGGYEEQYYTPEEYRTPLLYPDAFWELVGEEESSPILHMSEEDQLNWREYPLFEETWAPLAEFRHIIYDTEEESMEGPLGLETTPSSVASQVSQVESVLEGQTPNHFPYCAFQYERKRELQNPLIGDAGYGHWTKSMHPTKVQPKFAA